MLKFKKYCTCGKAVIHMLRSKVSTINTLLTSHVPRNWNTTGANVSTYDSHCTQHHQPMHQMNTHIHICVPTSQVARSSNTVGAYMSISSAHCTQQNKKAHDNKAR